MRIKDRCKILFKMCGKSEPSKFIETIRSLLYQLDYRVRIDH